MSGKMTTNHQKKDVPETCHDTYRADSSRRGIRNPYMGSPSHVPVIDWGVWPEVFGGSTGGAGAGGEASEPFSLE